MSNKKESKSDKIINSCSPEVIEKFWSRCQKNVNDKGCWEHNTPTMSQGYKKVSLKNLPILTHRAAFSFHYKIPAPFEGKIVRHKCDNMKCCNPEHLELGTYHDNARDTLLRGRNKNANKQFCNLGHKLVMIGNSYRGCRECRRERESRDRLDPIKRQKILDSMKKWRAKKKALQNSLLDN